MGSITVPQEVPPSLKRPWIETPLVHSRPLSNAAGCNIYLKLENLQPSGSFKSRGIGNMMSRAILSTSSPDQPVHFYCSSSGNAGLACATTALKLSTPSTRHRVTIAVNTAAAKGSPATMAKLRSLGAEVVVAGASWAESDAHMREVVMKENAVSGEKQIYVPPFDHPDIWEGAATVVDEIVAQMGTEVNGGIDAIVCNVGGGGLLNGVMEGLQRYYTPNMSMPMPKVLAVETIGADSLNASVKAGELVRLPGITSIATSLGATQVSEKTWEWARRYCHLGGTGEQSTGSEKERGKMISTTVTDAEAAMAAVRFLDDARIMVEVACGATIAMAYNGGLRKHLGGDGLSDEEWANVNVVLVVCGGSNVTFDILNGYKERFGGEGSFV